MIQRYSIMIPASSDLTENETFMQIQELSAVESPKIARQCNFWVELAPSPRRTAPKGVILEENT
jgi:hypothetical protein